MIILILYALIIFFVLYFIVQPLYLQQAIVNKFGSNCRRTFFPVIGGFIYSAIEARKTKSIYSRLNRIMKEKPDLKLIVSNRGCYPLIIFLDPDYQREGFKEPTSLKYKNYFLGYKYWN
jgi:hypothetical protein